MSIEWFLKLKEIDSLSKMRFKHLKAQSEQDTRLSQLNQRRHEAQSNYDHLKTEHSSLQQALFETEQKLKTASTQLERLRETGASDEKCLFQKNEIERWETQGFELLGKIDENHQGMEDARTFLNGLDKTIQEIAAEVSVENSGAMAEIRQLDMRMELLKAELPSDFKSLLEKVTTKKLAHGPFTRIDGGHCFFCRYKISSIDQSEIDMQQSLKTCNQCGRIFLPFGS